MVPRTLSFCSRRTSVLVSCTKSCDSSRCRSVMGAARGHAIAKPCIDSEQGSGIVSSSRTVKRDIENMGDTTYIIEPGGREVTAKTVAHGVIRAQSRYCRRALYYRLPVPSVLLLAIELSLRRPDVAI